MFTANILPGQGFQTFTVYQPKGSITSSGRAVPGSYEKTKVEFYGMLVGASQEEKEQWKQNGHPITHKIIEYSAQKKAKATDCLVSSTGQEFMVQGTKNPAGLNVTMIYYVEERFDIRKKV